MNVKINLPGIKLEQYKLGIDKKKKYSDSEEGREGEDGSQTHQEVVT